MPGVRAEDGTDACDEEEGVVGQAASPSDGGGDSDNAELREVLDTEGEESSSSTHSPFVQVGAKKVRGTFLFPPWPSNKFSPSEHHVTAPPTILHTSCLGVLCRSTEANYV